MGVVGTMLGESDVNIEAAQLSQTRDKSSSIMLLRVDQPVAPEVLEPIGAGPRRADDAADHLRVTVSSGGVRARGPNPAGRSNPVGQRTPTIWRSGCVIDRHA